MEPERRKKEKKKIKFIKDLVNSLIVTDTFYRWNIHLRIEQPHGERHWHSLPLQSPIRFAFI